MGRYLWTPEGSKKSRGMSNYYVIWGLSSAYH
jgi:hypothetical protein